MSQRPFLPPLSYPTRPSFGEQLRLDIPNPFSKMPEKQKMMREYGTALGKRTDQEPQMLMNCKITLWRTVFSALVLLAASALHLGATPTIWNGTNLTFTHVNGSNPLLAANQDRLTSDTWLTRSASQGLFNAHDESLFTHFSSPSGTEWANGFLTNYASLTYHDWNSWAKGVNGSPLSTVGVNAVLHLIPDDIYLSIKFTSWTSGGAGGGFSYIRSTPLIVPEPSAAILLLGGLALAAKFVRRRI